MSKTQYRGVVITDFRCEPYTSLPDGVQYIAWGAEKCPSSGRNHFQVFAYGKKRTVGGWARIFGRSHVEPMRGTFHDNETYCSKQSALQTIGEKPLGTGQRRDLCQIKHVIDKAPCGQNVMDIARDEDNFTVCVQYKRGLEAYLSNKRRRDVQADHEAPVVTFITGKPGSGKTRFVRENEPRVYDVSSLYWKDGYDMDEAVMYDNLEPDDLKPIRSNFLKEIDRYPIQVPVKGGFTTWKPKRIYITSIYTLDEFAAVFSDPEEIKRRITTVKTLPSI